MSQQEKIANHSIYIYHNEGSKWSEYMKIHERQSKFLNPASLTLDGWRGLQLLTIDNSFNLTKLTVLVCLGCRNSESWRTVLVLLWQRGPERNAETKEAETAWMVKYATASTLPLTMRCQKVVLRKLEANQTLAASLDMKQAPEIPCEKMCSVLGHVLANLLLVHLWKDNVDSSGFALLPSTTGSSRLELLGRDSYRNLLCCWGTRSSLGDPSCIHKTLAEQHKTAPNAKVCDQWKPGFQACQRQQGLGGCFLPANLRRNSTLGVDGKR